MRLLIIFVLMLSNSFASDASDIKNLVINKELKNYSDITFLNIKNKELNLNDYKGNISSMLHLSSYQDSHCNNR